MMKLEFYSSLLEIQGYKHLISQVINDLIFQSRQQNVSQRLRNCGKISRGLQWSLVGAVRRKLCLQKVRKS